MRIPIEEVKDGRRDGEIVWVCDYRIPDLNKKAIRAVHPTRTVILNESETSSNIYYSKSYFAPLDSKGKAKRTVISPADNTAYRSYPGIPLHVFTTEEECNDCYNEQCNVIIAAIDKKLASIVDELETQKQEILARKK